MPLTAGEIDAIVVRAILTQMDPKDSCGNEISAEARDLIRDMGRVIRQLRGEGRNNRK